MKVDYGRDLDLNLLRVLVVVADEGSVTRAAARLYLTQPAVSAALARLSTAVGARLFVRQGRGLALTSRGERLLMHVRPHVLALVEGALAPHGFDARTSERMLRVGLSDAHEPWMLPALLRVLTARAPRMRIIAVPIQFRTVAEALATRRVDVAVTVADELPATVKRQGLFRGEFVCLFDPRHVKVKGALTERAYFAEDHVIVSYNGDLRGVVEDALGKQRRVRCAVASFHSIGPVVDGTALLATVPGVIAAHVRATRPHLRAVPLPFTPSGAETELLWPAALDDDEACRFLRAQIVAITPPGRPPSRSPARPRDGSPRGGRS